MINKYFVIYGERDSGTNYLETILSGRSYHLSHDTSAFNTSILNSSVTELNNNIYGHKHFFGFHDEQIKKTTANIIFVGIIRNPYDWIIALHNTQHHIPSDNQDIRSFLTHEWYSIQHDKKHPKYRQELMNDRDFETGLRYKNIFAMRSKKLKYLFETMPLLTPNYELIKYEDLCNDPMNILAQWSKKYGLELNPSFMQPIIKEPYPMSAQTKEIIDKNIDWNIENKVGYFKQEN